MQYYVIYYGIMLQHVVVLHCYGIVYHSMLYMTLCSDDVSLNGSLDVYRVMFAWLLRSRRTLTRDCTICGCLLRTYDINQCHMILPMSVKRTSLLNEPLPCKPAAKVPFRLLIWRLSAGSVSWRCHRVMV